MKSLYLGLGKVNLALAKQIDGIKMAFVEEVVDGQPQVVISKAVGRKQAFEEIERASGDFDSFDWRKHLPADVFISPGVDPRRKFFSELRDFEVRELDYFCSKFKGRVIAITGTDGKSKFTTQLGEVLRRALPKTKIFVGGNLGTAMADALTDPYGIAVLEVSSFQAERLRSTEIAFGILLNLDSDHLDRYDSLQDYYAAKWNLLRAAKTAIYPYGVDRPEGVSRSPVRFSNHENISVILRKCVEYLATTWKFELSESLFENLPSLPHRLERFTDKSGRHFVNDSKATTVHAVLYALQILQPEFPAIRLILGGRHKGDDFSRLCAVIRQTDQVLVCGEAREKIASQISSLDSRVKKFETLSALLKQVVPEMSVGDCLLLSPGCSSYDEFENFEERGEFFQRECGLGVSKAG